MLELGTTAWRLRRSSKNEWLLPGTEGFYWGCNNTKDLKVRLDTVASLTERPENVAWAPSDRDKAWLTQWIQNPKSVIDSGDPYAQKLLQDARGVLMPTVAGVRSLRLGGRENGPVLR